MDLQALQQALRRFAAERDWQPLHTPKNLAMALMVESAELAEIFQWLTPEQSSAAAADAGLRERIGDELADIFIYLVQLADHTAVDLERAVDRKRLKNLQKNPLRPLAVAAEVETVPTARMHVLVDWENVQPKENDIRTLVPEATDLWLFHGPSQKNVGLHHASFGERAVAVPIARTGKNALDFHLAFYMGYIASRHPTARFVVLSNDKGYGPMIEHAGQLGFGASQLGLGGRRAAKSTVSKKTVAGQRAAGAAKTASRKSAAPAGAAKTARPVKAAKKATSARTVPTVPTSKRAAVKAPATRAAAKKARAGAAPAKKASAARKAPAAKTAARPLPAADAGPPPAAAPVHAGIDAAQALRHVLAVLAKTPEASRPTRLARLQSAIKSLLRPHGDEAAARRVLEQMVAAGKVSIDDKGAVRYLL